MELTLDVGQVVTPAFLIQTPLVFNIYCKFIRDYRLNSV